MLKTILTLLVMTTVSFAEDSANNSLAQTEAQIRNLEKAYWDYVKSNDLQKYRALWHADFVGWPFVSAAPLNKDHITDWITSNTTKGLKLQSYGIEQLVVRITGDIAIDYYRLSANWTRGDTGEVARRDLMRITHTWIRTDGRWQILGGMSAAVNADGK
ncbi:MAG TPA: nuclear transport factor 2 family protein [Candidatus Udaeobacter sp.]|jgi:ketosteroid isomerase-like protein|nr:nuclear transport factor 2 family protein [Candidatus Udaeobacter sp.]